MRHTERRDQDRTASHHAPPAPRRETGVAAEVLALQRIVGNEAVAEIMAEQPEIQRFTAHDVLRRSGSPLPDAVRGDMESRLGADFSTVRVHTGAAAEQSATELGARAYTSGEHIVLGAGAGDPHTLAHELSHVIQQRSGPVAGADNGGGLAVSDPSDAFERAAEASATRALSGAAPTAHPAHASGQHGVALQRARVADIQGGLTAADMTRLGSELLDLELIVPVTLPSAGRMGSRLQTNNSNQGQQDDQRLFVDPNDHTIAHAAITWRQVIAGDNIQMAYSNQGVWVVPHSGPSVAAAITDLLGLRADPGITRDPLLDGFTTSLMTWLMRQRSQSTRDAEVSVTPTSSDEGEGMQVAIEGRPGWNPRANEIVTGHGEERRHIIAWHAMRGAFRRVFNTALADGEQIEDRMRRLIAVLDQATTWAELKAADASDTSSETSGDQQMADVASAGGSQGSAMDVDTASRPASPASTATTSDELRARLTERITQVMGLLNSNPFNLWAGEGVPNESINSVGTQLTRLLNAGGSDADLIENVRTRAADGAGRANQDRAVWTEVRDMLTDVSPTDARTYLQSIIDSTDVDIPVTGADETSSTYGDIRNQIAVIQHVLGTGLAQELLAMGAGQLPADFDTLLDETAGWLRRFLRPRNLRSSMTGGHRIVHRRGDPGAQ